MLRLTNHPEATVRFGSRYSPMIHGLLVLALLLTSTACQRGEAMDNGASADEATESGTSSELKVEDLPPVEVATLGRGPIESVLRFSTNLEAESEVQVFSQASRQVTNLLVEEGDRVRRGEVLVRLQDDEQRAELARIESQLSKARREYERQKNLFSRELISEQAMNDATYEVEQLEIGVTDAQRMLGYTEVAAPISGTVTTRHVNLGDTITVNQLLFDLVDFDTIVARVYVPERELARLKLGQEARLFSNSLGSEARIGEVIRIAPIVDPRSGTVKVTVGIPRNQGLLPGMYVEVELVTATHEDALLLPKRSVVYDENRAYVYRLVEEAEGDTQGYTVDRMEIEVLLADRELIEPAGDALKAGDRVVIAGQAGLKDGTQVRLAEGFARTTSATEAADRADSDAADADADSVDTDEEAR